MIPNTGLNSELNPTWKLQSIVERKLKCCQDKKYFFLLLPQVHNSVNETDTKPLCAY